MGKKKERREAEDEGRADLLRESEAQRMALAEFKEQWGQLAKLHVGLLRDANEASARHRRTAEILEFYREDMARRWEAEIRLVENEHGGRQTPGGRMRFDVNKGWHRNENTP